MYSRIPGVRGPGKINAPKGTTKASSAPGAPGDKNGPRRRRTR